MLTTSGDDRMEKNLKKHKQIIASIQGRIENLRMELHYSGDQAKTRTRIHELEMLLDHFRDQGWM